ncbi:MAG: glycosyltransferase family 4 protein [Deltaproteobacteria bacterium]
MKLLVLTSYPDQAACTRFRISAFIPALERAGIEVRSEPFLDSDLFSTFYRAGYRRKNALGVARAIASRVVTTLRARRYDGVFVQREAALLGPAITEELLARGLRLPLIYDIDDAVWLAGKGASTNATRYPLLSRLLKAPSKSLRMLSFATTVIAGSRYLADFASRYCARTEIIPTVVSRETWRPLPGRLETAALSTPPVIGWIGTHSTAPQLALVAPALARLRAEGREFSVRVIGAGEDFKLDGVELDRRPWSKDREVTEFQSLDVGIAPMFKDEWSEGKCGFKQLQYMAVGVPMVTSVAGGARDFVTHGQNALVAETEDDWYPHLAALLDDAALRRRLATNGRQLVETRYSREAVEDRFVAIVRDTLGRT